MTNFMKSRHVARAGIIAAGVIVLVGGAGAGAFAAGSPPLVSPTGLAPAAGAPSTPKAKPHYPVNARGLTYGSAKDADSPANEPDLIAADTRNDLTPAAAAKMSPAAVAARSSGGGKHGYVRKDELAAADGSNVTTPEEAVEWMQTGAKTDHVVTVYESDGVTPIGTFIVYGTDSQAAEGQPSMASY